MYLVREAKAELPERSVWGDVPGCRGLSRDVPDKLTYDLLTPSPCVEDIQAQFVKIFDNVSAPSLPFFSDDEFVDLEKEFEENELNSAVYLISIAMQISNFAVNYKVNFPKNV